MNIGKTLDRAGNVVMAVFFLVGAVVFLSAFRLINALDVVFRMVFGSAIMALAGCDLWTEVVKGWWRRRSFIVRVRFK